MSNGMSSYGMMSHMSVPPPQPGLLPPPAAPVYPQQGVVHGMVYYQPQPIPPPPPPPQ